MTKVPNFKTERAVGMGRGVSQDNTETSNCNKN